MALEYAGDITLRINPDEPQSEQYYKELCANIVKHLQVFLGATA